MLWFECSAFKLDMIDKNKVWYYKCNYLGHFTIKFGKLKVAPTREKYVPYEKKSSYEDHKKDNKRLKLKLNAMTGNIKEGHPLL